MKEKLLYFLEILCKRFQAKLGLARVAKSFMDTSKPVYSILECEIIRLADSYEIVGEVTDVRAAEEGESNDERRYLLFVIREVIRRNFIVLTKQQIKEYLGCTGYETRIKLEFFIEQYAFVLFPFLPLSKPCGEDNTNDSTGYSNECDEDIFSHDGSPLVNEFTKKLLDAVFPIKKNEIRQGSKTQNQGDV
jgi:hypothetical protein